MLSQQYFFPRLAQFQRLAVELGKRLHHFTEAASQSGDPRPEPALAAEEHALETTTASGGHDSPPLLVHYHIFKNAGTSFEWALHQVFGDGFRSFDKETPRGFVSAEDLADLAVGHPDLRAVSSHQAAPPGPRIAGRRVLTSILIRDPIARVRSIYAFERSQQASTTGAIKAKELSFRQYVDWRLQTSPAMLCNYQVHFCTRAKHGAGGRPDRERLAEAIANLDAVDVVGTVARYDEWISLAESVLAGAFPGLTLPSAHRNVTSAGKLPEAEILQRLVAELGKEAARYLVQNNKLDMCLYQVADALLTRRLAERGIKLTLLEAYSSRLENQKCPPVGTNPR